MAYTTYNKVANFLGFPDGYFTTVSTPTIAQVENLIARADSSIELKTGHVWREKTITNEYPTFFSKYEYGTGISLDLKQRSIRTISKLEIWNGSTWEDWKVTKTEGRNNDYWVDYTNGIIFLVSLRNIFRQGVKVTYTYGENSVPESIEAASTMMTAISLLSNPEFSVVMFTEASQNNSRQMEKINFWKEEIRDILAAHVEWKVF